MTSGFSLRYENACDVCRKLFSEPLFYVPALCLILFGFLSAGLAVDPALFMRIAAGRLIQLQGHLPLEDPFAFTLSKASWLNSEWLADLVFYLISRLAGDFGLFTAKIVLIVSGIILLAAAQRLYGDRHSGYFFWLFLCSMQCLPFWTANVGAGMFNALFLPLFLYAFVLHQRRSRSFLLYLLPFATLLWVNLHPGLAVGFVFFFLYTLDCLWRRRREALAPFLALALCLLAALANPHGGLDYLLSLPANLLDSSIDRPSPDVPGLYYLPAGLAVIMLAIGIYLKGRQTDRLALIFLLAAAYLGYANTGFIPVFMMVAAVYGSPPYLEFLESSKSRWPHFLRGLKRGASLLMLLAVVPPIIRLGSVLTSYRDFSLDYSGFPLSALEWLRTSRPGGSLLVNSKLGSYALWRLYPRFLVSLDTRLDSLYPKETLAMVSSALNPEDSGHPEAIEQLRPDYILLSLKDYPEQRQQLFGSQWNLIYADRQFVILATRPNEDKSVGSAPAGTTGIWEPLF